jgi:hypothetical protein
MIASNRQPAQMYMVRLTITTLALVALTAMAGCKNVPGWDGRYATHDRGNNNRGSP